MSVKNCGRGSDREKYFGTLGVNIQWMFIVFALHLFCFAGSGRAEPFSFEPYLEGQSGRIVAQVQSLNPVTGEVSLNGFALDLAAAPQWDFGDGTIVSSWFPAMHTYSVTSVNYIATVTGEFNDGMTDSARVLVRFVSSTVAQVPVTESLQVTIPDAPVTLESRMPGYGFSDSLTCFDASAFGMALSRENAEYVLTIGAMIQDGLVRSRVEPVSGAFNQVVLKDPAFSGMYSIWYSSPVAFGAGAEAFGPTVEYASFFHEMGHNVTLNFPAGYYYGGKIDGNANAIYSETMAQIMQHATAYEMINRALDYGLPPDMVTEIRQSAIAAVGVMRDAYLAFLAAGAPFSSWNSPATPEDDTFGTFMTLAFKFCEKAEERGEGYAIPVKRMCDLLSLFDGELQVRYAPQNDTPEASAFRSTLMVAAISHAFGEDLRPDFLEMNFPIDEEVYDSLMESISPEEGEGEGEGEPFVYHPADLNADRRLIMGEAIAYLSGWQRGGNPMAYAIRAAYLWQNGEHYLYDAGSTAPLCWVLAP